MEDRPEHRVHREVPPRPGCWTVTVRVPWFLGPRSLALGGPLPPQGWPRQRQWAPSDVPAPRPGSVCCPEACLNRNLPLGLCTPMSLLP